MAGVAIPWDFLFKTFKIHAAGAIGDGDGRRLEEQTALGIAPDDRALLERELFDVSLDLVDSSFSVGPATLDLYAGVGVTGDIDFNVELKGDKCVKKVFGLCIIPGASTSYVIHRCRRLFDPTSRLTSSQLSSRRCRGRSVSFLAHKLSK